jgi:hypothetical protein
MTARPMTMDLKVLWRNVSSARGTRAPDAAGLTEFLEGLSDDARDRLQSALLLCKKGTEANNEIAILSWASACTHGAMLATAHESGFLCTQQGLFSAGLMLIDEGSDPYAVVMNLKNSPALSETLRQLLSPPVRENTGHPVAAPGAAEPRESSSISGVSKSTSHAQVRTGITPHEVGFEIFENEAPSPPADRKIAGAKQPQGQPDVAPLSSSNKNPWVTVRLFGKSAAHTLEIVQHRRAGHFLGVSVVSIESARPIPNGGFDWDNKLTIQLTPEEMPEVIAVLLGILKEATISNHGADRNKSASFRNQEGGLVIVTSRRSETYPVPVQTSVMYYLLDLFCRAMAEGSPGRNPTDVIALVRGIYS